MDDLKKIPDETLDDEMIPELDSAVDDELRRLQPYTDAQLRHVINNSHSEAARRAAHLLLARSQAYWGRPMNPR